MMDHPSEVFGAVASAYARHRLTYPPAFFDALAARLPPGAPVWDCACGTGQASVDLARRGLRVIATDASPSQLAEARLHPGVRYRQAPAEASGLEPGSVAAVLVAAAVHWFDVEAFNAEVRRVTRPGGLVAWIGYLPLSLAPAEAPHGAVLEALERFRTVRLAPWWAPACSWVESGYRGLPFPVEEEPFPRDLWIERHWNLAALLAHLGTTSAVQRCRKAGDDPLPALAAELAGLWPADGARPLHFRWPFMGRWGRLPGD